MTLLFLFFLSVLTQRLSTGLGPTLFFTPKQVCISLIYKALPLLLWLGGTCCKNPLQSQTETKLWQEPLLLLQPFRVWSKHCLPETETHEQVGLFLAALFLGRTCGVRQGRAAVRAGALATVALQEDPGTVPPGHGSIGAAPHWRATALRMVEFTDMLTEHEVILCLCKKNNSVYYGKPCSRLDTVSFF